MNTPENLAGTKRSITPATRFANLKGDYGTSDFVMHRGGRLPKITIAYESWGELSNNNDNVVLVFTGLSPSAHAASSDKDPSPGWWEYMIGPGKPIDTNEFYVICVNSLGSCFGSTGPEAINPKTAKPYGTDFPDLTIEDIAKAGHHLLVELGIDHLHTVVGSSMGGMVSLAYALQYPGEVDYLVSISAATRALPFTIAMRSLQREIIRGDCDWNNGHYYETGEPLSGMALARKLGLVSYRAPEEWHQRFDRTRIARERRTGKPFELEFEVESYLDYNAQKFIHNFDANSYLYLSRTMDWFDVAEHGGTVNAGLSKIQVKKALIIGVNSDILFPVEQQREIVDGLQKAGTNVEYVEIESINGHDAFLVDAEQFSPVIHHFLTTSCRE
ncbi:MAG: homoserine O-acetyltransferase [Gammaproteobacteria bacterium]|jgi:homoserine O-acetyltransferase